MVGECMLSSNKFGWVNPPHWADSKHQKQTLTFFPQEKSDKIIDFNKENMIELFNNLEDKIWT